MKPRKTLLGGNESGSLLGGGVRSERGPLRLAKSRRRPVETLGPQQELKDNLLLLMLVNFLFRADLLVAAGLLGHSRP